MSVGIGSAAILLGVSIVTLRRWEELGRLLPAQRTAGGDRRYALADLRQKNMAEDSDASMEASVDKPSGTLSPPGPGVKSGTTQSSTANHG